MTSGVIIHKSQKLRLHIASVHIDFYQILLLKSPKDGRFFYRDLGKIVGGILYNPENKHA